MSVPAPTSFLLRASESLRSARYWTAVALLCSAVTGCNGNKPPADSSSQPKPSILLITLDTTRADVIGPDAAGVATPSFNAVAARGRRYANAYAAVPETLPSHTSMMTGLYPAGHGVHENARYVAASTPLAAEQLQKAGYRTTAFVSSFVLAKRFGLARGFDVYDDQLPSNAAERTGAATADAAIAELSAPSQQPRFMWVHLNDPHAPYAPPEPYRSQYAASPYRGEVAAMDHEIGRLVTAFEKNAQRAAGPIAVVIAADHGEGLGEHGEQQHGHLLYQATMHVPLVVMGPGIAIGVSDVAVSTRRIYFTLLDWAGLGAAHSLRSSADDNEVVTGEAMKPFLEYGWQPQVMAVQGRHKAMLSGRVEAYDLSTDGAERKDIAATPDVPSAVRNALYDYPVPVPGAATQERSLNDEARQKLAALGYVSGGAAPIVRKNAPRAVDMIPVLTTLVNASSAFGARRYAEAVPLLESALKSDAGNVGAMLQLATSYSMLGRSALAGALFERASELAPASDDVKVYRALHIARTDRWPQALPVLESALKDTPDREPVIEAVAALRAREGQQAMAGGRTNDAIASFERARTLRADAFPYNLELGVLYLAARRFADAAAALDRVPPSSSGYPMALFKRAQAAVLLKAPDAPARIAAARTHADATTRQLIQTEKLFSAIR